MSPVLATFHSLARGLRRSPGFLLVAVITLGVLEEILGSPKNPLTRDDIEDIFWLQATIARELAVSATTGITERDIVELERINDLLAAAVGTSELPRRRGPLEHAPTMPARPDLAHRRSRGRNTHFAVRPHHDHIRRPHRRRS